MATTFGYVAKNEFAELVAASTVDAWRQTLAILLSFTSGAELKTLCNALGQKLAAQLVIDGAVSCFMCAQNVAELVALWTNPDTGTGTNNQGDRSRKKEDVVLHAAITKALVFVKALEGRGEGGGGSGQAAQIDALRDRITGRLQQAPQSQTSGGHGDGRRRDSNVRNAELGTRPTRPA